MKHNGSQFRKANSAGVTKLLIDQAYHINHPPNLVFANWIAESAVFPPVERIEVDPVRGGIYRLIMPGNFTMEGRITEIEPNRLLRYSWQWTGAEEVTEVTVRFTARSKGTEISVRHTGFLSAESRESHAEGWDRYVENLRKHLDSL